MAEDTLNLRLLTWMSKLDDNTNITDLTIPGTHDSGANFDVPILPPLIYVPDTSKNQDLSIRNQLNIGVRYLDIR